MTKITLMKLTSYESDIFWKAWTVYEMFRRLGFSNNNIFLAHKPNSFISTTELSVVLKTQSKEFGVSLGEVPWIFRHSDLQEKWAFFCKDTLAKATDDELDTMWERSCISKDKTKFVKTFIGKGFFIPHDLN